MIAFDVLGEPKSQPRPKAARIGGFIRIYTPATAKAWKGAVAKAAAPFLRSGPLSGPLVLGLVFRFARPKSHITSKGVLTKGAPAFHAKKPDVDNLAKAVMDALTDAGLWEDDDQVISLHVSKQFGTPEGVSVSIHSPSLAEFRALIGAPPYHPYPECPTEPISPALPAAPQTP